mmetsp:Transcript_142285/g.265196  ORF Transcript_142285/g.265196 Transcript_142285/m.265196 type:complete len:156 (+) Transcript_142285:1488-1955(+)
MSWMRFRDCEMRSKGKRIRSGLMKPRDWSVLVAALLSTPIKAAGGARLLVIQDLRAKTVSALTVTGDQAVQPGGKKAGEEGKESHQGKEKLQGKEEHGKERGVTRDIQEVQAFGGVVSRAVQRGGVAAQRATASAWMPVLIGRCRISLRIGAPPS